MNTKISKTYINSGRHFPVFLPCRLKALNNLLVHSSIVKYCLNMEGALVSWEIIDIFILLQLPLYSPVE